MPFISELSDFYVKVDRWQTVADPDLLIPRVGRGLRRLFDEIRITVGEETQIVQAVFPNPIAVMQVFLQRVFAQSVSVCF